LLFVILICRVQLVTLSRELAKIMEV